MPRRVQVQVQSPGQYSSLEEDNEQEYAYYPDGEVSNKEIFRMAKKRMKSLIAAFILLSIGIVFFGLGLLSILEDWWYAFPCFLVSFITASPGGYVWFLTYKIWQRDPDYSWEMITSFENTT